MKITPNPNKVFPVVGFKTVTNVKPTLTNPNVFVGDFTYYSGDCFQKQVTHHQKFYGDKLIIGKFCQIAHGVRFVMNGANHQMNAVTTFPFYIMEGWEQKTPELTDLPIKGDTIIGNDVWIGENTTILPGVKIGDGAIIGLNSVVASNVDAYTIVAGNPAKQIRKRFDDELTNLLLEFKWWDLPVEEINELIPLLTSSDLEMVKRHLKERLKRA